MKLRKLLEVEVMEGKLLNVGEVASYLELPEEKVIELVERGVLPAYKIGGVHLRFKKEQVEQYKARDIGLFAEKSGTAKEDIAEGSFETSERREYSWAGRNRDTRGISSNQYKYRFWERIEDFLYYNDFYILSAILFALILYAILNLS